MRKSFKYILSVALLATCFSSFGQQDPQFTQYMYNTMAVNPGYTGSRGHLSIIGLHRSQWVGLDGAPRTQSLGIHSPVGNNVGLGLSVVHDELGPATETFIDGNFSYTLKFENNRRLSFGVKGGLRNLNVDFSKGTIQEGNDILFQNNINNRFLGTIGAGFYYHTNKWYVGLAVPNFLTTRQYDDLEEAIAIERLHYFAIAGYVFDLNENLKFKPSAYFKAVPGAPVIFDVSGNFLINEKFTAGLAYRWDDSVSGLLGFQISEQLNIGYAFDYTTTELTNYNNGTHEIFLRFDLITREKKLKSPRFF
ncbi:MAG: type IX secretion system membrane protein PorP/SprF [Bacteroidota bacterium]